MEDDKFYSWISFVLGVSGFLGTISLCAFFWAYRKNGIDFGRSPYSYFFLIVIASFICNICVRKKIAVKSGIAKAGFFFGLLSILPIVLFFISLILVLTIGPFLLVYIPPQLL